MSGKIATAYVQVVPSARGIRGKLSGVFGKEGGEAGSSFGSSMIGKIKGLIATAGIGAAFGKAITSGADLQQSLGGVETLFKDSADIVIKNAEQAYKTAGMSANSYMEAVTGFSASLLQGLGGDTQKAASIADMAMTDMSDNANKMGTSMESIQNAYQGFAKQNYTMLDNLKLGYGGTKTEMERLLADAEKLTGVKYDISNLSDVYEAIHAVQEEMGITGTTALEASSTISGSLASMKAAFSDVLGNLSLGRDIQPSLQALGDSIFTFLTGNLMPAVGNILSGIPDIIGGALDMGIRGLNIVANNAETIVQMGIDLVTGIGTSIITALPYLAEAAVNIVVALGTALLNTDWVQIGQNVMSSLRTSLDLAAGEILGTDGDIIGSVLTAITTNLPSVLDQAVDIAVNIANGLLNGLPGVISAAGSIIAKLLEAITKALPELLSSGIALIGQLAQGIMDNLPAIVESINSVLDELISIIMDNLPAMLEQGISLIGELASGLLQNLPAIIGAIADILAELLASIGEHLPDMLEQGLSLIGEMAAGLIAAIPDVAAAIPEIFKEIFKAFGDQDWGKIGSDIISGIGKGISSAASTIANAAKEAAKKALDAAKRFLGIASPSKVMRDQVGKFIPEGMAVGIEANTKPLTDAMHSLSDLTSSSLQENLSVSNIPTRPVDTGRVYGDSSVTINVYASENQDVDELAEVIMQKEQFAISQREACIA